VAVIGVSFWQDHSTDEAIAAPVQVTARGSQILVFAVVAVGVTPTRVKPVSAVNVGTGCNGRRPYLFFKRRSLTASQRAIAAGRAWLRAEAEGRVLTGKGGDRRSKDQSPNGALIHQPRDYFAALYGVGKNYVEMAHALARERVARKARHFRGVSKGLP
jgi:hypothetical protein